MARRAPFWVVGIALALATPAKARDVSADPSSYRTALSTLVAGDVLHLAAGDYGLLAIRNLNGAPGAWITITGPTTGTPATFHADPGPCCNTVEISDSSFVDLDHVTIDGGHVDGAFGISAQSGIVHDIRIEGCTLVNHDGSQQHDAISTKVPTWGWIIRGNRIENPGTGLYLGNSDGSDPFIGGLIEDNLVENPIGYCMEIKFQLPRPSVAGMPTTPTSTIIRNNVFIKNDGPSPDGDRPNVLVGGFPDSGPGSDDRYEIYGNLFFHNPRESLLQVSGRVTIHDNIFVDSAQNAITLQDHDLPLKLAYVYNNTIYGTSSGIRFGNSAPQGDAVVDNLVFAGTPIAGPISDNRDNLTLAVSDAPSYVNAPSLVLGQMDFYPLAGKCEGSPSDLSKFANDVSYDRDFNGTSKGNFTFRGAYAGSGVNPGWPLARDIKTTGSEPDGGAAGSGGASGAGGTGGAPAAGGTAGQNGSSGNSGTAGVAGSLASGGAPVVENGGAAGSNALSSGGTGASSTGGAVGAAAGDSGGCGCRSVDRGSAPSPYGLGLALAFGRLLARRRSCSHVRRNALPAAGALLTSLVALGCSSDGSSGVAPSTGSGGSSATGGTSAGGTNPTGGTSPTGGAGAGGSGGMVGSGGSVSVDGGGGSSSGGASGSPSVAFIPPERRIDWSTAGVPGGIPTRTTVCASIDAAAYGNGTQDASSAVNDAIKNCPAGQVVALTAGHFLLANAVQFHFKSDVTLRGTGPDKTVLFPSGKGILLGDDNPVAMTATVTSGATKGSTKLTLSATNEIAVGTMIKIDRDNAPSGPNDPTDADLVQPNPGTLYASPDPNREIKQLALVTAIDGNVVTISPPLIWDFTSKPGLFYFARKISGSGVEDLKLDHSQGGDGESFNFDQGYGCWVKNVSSYKPGGYHSIETNSLNCEVRDSYFDDSKAYGADNAGMALYGTNTAWKIENNVFEKTFPGIELQLSSSGNYMGYNYGHAVETGAQMSGAMFDDNHGAHDMMNLWEGNVGEMYQSDGYFGSASHGTLFRNHFTADNAATKENLKAISLNRWSHYYSVVGNVLGTAALASTAVYEATDDGYSDMIPVMYQLGYPNMGNTSFTSYDGRTPPGLDRAVKNTLIRYKNYDYVHKSIWSDSSTIPDAPLPASLYYSAKPAWWPAATPWPPIGPDVAGFTNKIPAETRFESGIP